MDPNSDFGILATKVYIYFMYTYFTFLQIAEKVQKLQCYSKKNHKTLQLQCKFLRNSPIKHFWSHQSLKISWNLKELIDHFIFQLIDAHIRHKTRCLSSSHVIRSVGSEQKSTKTLASAETEPFPCEILSLYFHKWLPIIWGYFWGGHIRGSSDGAGDRWSAVCIKRHTSFIYWTLLVKRWLKKESNQSLSLCFCSRLCFVIVQIGFFFRFSKTRHGFVFLSEFLLLLLLRLKSREICYLLL